MSLLELESVTKLYRSGPAERIALQDVSLTVTEGELVVVYGARKSGRSTLLRVAAGLEPPDSGIVRVEGHTLGARGATRLLERIGYCQRRLGSSEKETVREHLELVQWARGERVRVARSRTRSSLERVECIDVLHTPTAELSPTERVRVSVATALTLEPRLLVIDEPTLGVDVLDRDAILGLLRALADDGIAVLATTGESTAFAIADRALSIRRGRLHGDLHPGARVIPLHRSA